VFLLVRKDLNNFFSDREKNNAGTDPIARLALLIHDACNPSGVNILIDFDGTRTETLFEFAAQIKNYIVVADSYKVQFNENLTERLSKELTPDEFKKFFDIVSASGGGTIPKPATAIGKIAVAAAAVNVLEFDASTKVSKTAKAGETLGKVIASAQFNTKNGYVEYWVIEWDSYIFFTSKGYVEKTKVYLQ
jgi:hypothetical protein